MMRETNVGYLARSLAGHDKGKVYMIIREDDKHVYLADGKLHTIAKPKKKNPRHLQLIKKYEKPELTEKLLKEEATDLQIIQEVKNVES